MKLVEAIIKPFKLEEVKIALNAIGLEGMTVAPVRGLARQHGHTEIYAGSEYDKQFVPKIKIEIVVPAERLDEVIACIIAAARSGKIGDGKIFVIDVERSVRIRTGERDEKAV